MDVLRLHVPFDDDFESSLRRARAAAVELMRDRGQVQLALGVSSIAVLDSVFRTVFGNEAIGELERLNRHDRKGHSLLLLTEKIRMRRVDGPVIAAFVAPETLERVLACAGISAIVYVADSADALAQYVERHPASREVDTDSGSEVGSLSAFGDLVAPPPPVHSAPRSS